MRLVLDKIEKPGVSIHFVYSYDLHIFGKTMYIDYFNIHIRNYPKTLF